MSRGQKRALRELGPAYALDTSKLGDRPIILDVGFGTGDSTVALARTFQDCDVVGCEVHVPGIAATVQRLADHNCTNVQLVRADVFALLKLDFPVAACFIGFPDPWPHNPDRRLIRPEFIDLLADRLTSSSSDTAVLPPPLSLATDSKAYADHALRLLDDTGWQLLDLLGVDDQSPRTSSCENLHVSPSSSLNQRPDWRPVSKYEQRARDAGRSVWDLAWSQ